MSNEVNISQVSSAWAAPGIEWEINNWTNVQRQKARFFTVLVEPPNIQSSGPYDMEITRVWSTTWVTDTLARTYQWNVRVKNTGGMNTSYILWMAETDN